MKIVMHTDDGSEVDITEAVQIVYDALHASMDFGSGFLDTSEVDAMRVMTKAAGWEPLEYNLDVCQTCGHRRNEHRSYGDSRACLIAPSGWRVLNEPDGTPVVRKCECVAFVAEWEVAG